MFLVPVCFSWFVMFCVWCYVVFNVVFVYCSCSCLLCGVVVFFLVSIWFCCCCCWCLVVCGVVFVVAVLFLICILLCVCLFVVFDVLVVFIIMFFVFTCVFQTKQTQHSMIRRRTTGGGEGTGGTDAGSHLRVVSRDMNILEAVVFHP